MYMGQNIEYLLFPLHNVGCEEKISDLFFYKTC